jgi:hypothetical protein
MGRGLLFGKEALSNAVGYSLSGGALALAGASTGALHGPSRIQIIEYDNLLTITIY